MAVNVVLTALCIGGVAFYLRFLVALCVEYKQRWICYLLRLHDDAGVSVISEPREVETSLPRAA